MKKLLIICVVFIAPMLYANETPVDPDVKFHNFAWGTSLKDFTAKMGRPVHTEERDGMQSIIYDNITVSGYPVFLLAYFSKNGLEGGTYYFHTTSLDELMQCYKTVQKELLDRYGFTKVCDGIIRELRPYESSWNLKNGLVYLKVNTRQNEPVTLWYSSPAFTKSLMGS